MKAAVFHGVGDIRVDNVPEPQIQATTDVIVRITASAICGTDLHMVRGTLPGITPGTILGHEAVGVVQEVGREVRNLKAGDRVVIPSTIACGYCSYCRAGHHAQCDNANPNGSLAGTCFFGGPAQTGPIHGLQAEYARVPFANTGLVKLPDDLDDDRAIMLSDIFPTGYFGADIAGIKPGDSVAVFGCGPVGQFTIASALLMRAGRILAVDCISSRLDMARAQGAEVINFNEEDPLDTIRNLTGGIGVDRAIDAVGVDSVTATQGPAAKEAEHMSQQFGHEVQQIAPDTRPQGENWHPGNAPSQAITWAVKALAKAGTLSVIGVYPHTDQFFPLGTAMNKNLSLQMGNCNHRRYIPLLIDVVRSGKVDPMHVLTHVEPLSSVLDAYKAFDRRQPGWIKVELKPDGDTATAA
ncbi:MAG: zinc-dependent alcohol dehydrogenase [Nitrospira sp.]